MAELLRTADVERWLEASGWELIHRTGTTIVLRNKQGALLPIPLHPTRPDLLYLSELMPRVPALRQEFMEAAFEEIPFDGFGFDILIDPEEAGTGKIPDILDALRRLHLVMGGSGFIFLPPEEMRNGGSPHTHTEAAFVRCRAQINPRTSLEVRQEIRAALRAVGAMLTCLSGAAVEESDQSSNAIRAALAKTTARVQTGDLIAITTIQPAPSADERMAEEEPDPSDVRTALQAIVDGINAYRESGGGLALSAEDMRRQVRQAGQEFPHDRLLTGMQHTLAYLGLKDVGHLPSLPSAAVQLLELTSDVNVGTDDLVRVIQQDPAMTARILKHANSAYVGLRVPANTITRAILPLGHQTLRALALAFSLIDENRTGACAAFDYDMFWKESSARAATARHMAAHLRCGVDPNEALSAGLLCQLGRLAFATAMPDRYADILQAVNPSIPGHLLHLERHRFGIDHQEVAAEMIAGWGLSEYIWQAIQAQDSPSDPHLAPVDRRAQALAQILQCTTIVWRILTTTQIPIEARIRGDVRRQTQRLGMPSSQFGDRFDQAQTEWEELAGILDITPLRTRAWADVSA